MSLSRKRKALSAEVHNKHTALVDKITRELQASELFITNKLKSEHNEVRDKASELSNMTMQIKQEQLPQLMRSLDSVKEKIRTIKHHEAMLTGSLRKLKECDRKNRYNKIVDLETDILRKQVFFVTTLHIVCYCSNDIY
jgi:hypothetical protein